MESRKQAARRPRPPFPSAASCSCEMTSSMRKPSSPIPSVFRQLSVIQCYCNDMSPTGSGILLLHVEHSIVQSSAHQKLERKIVNALLVSKGLALLSLVPVQNQSIPEGQSGSCIGSRFVAVVQRASERGLDVLDGFGSELIGVREGFGRLKGKYISTVC